MKMLYFVSVLLGGILLVPSRAHVLEMARKLAMDRDTYFATQQLYLGWALFGIPIVVKIALDTWLGVSSRRAHRVASRAALVSAALIAAEWCWMDTQRWQWQISVNNRVVGLLHAKDYIGGHS